jgi:hypothetical protein
MSVTHLKRGADRLSSVRGVDLKNAKPELRNGIAVVEPD